MSNVFSQNIQAGIRSEVNVHIIKMGGDYSISISGGEDPHIGAVTLSEARSSLTGQGIGVTTSSLVCLGHKEESLARAYSEAFSREFNCKAVCACGIHIDRATFDEIREINHTLLTFLNDIIERIKEGLVVL